MVSCSGPAIVRLTTWASSYILPAMQDYCRRIPSRAHKLRTIPSTYPVRPHPRKLWSSTVTATDGGPMGDGNVSTTEPVELAQEAPSPRAQAPPTGWQRTFAALRHRNYRLW